MIPHQPRHASGVVRDLTHACDCLPGQKVCWLLMVCAPRGEGLVTVHQLLLRIWVASTSRSFSITNSIHAISDKPSSDQASCTSNVSNWALALGSHHHSMVQNHTSDTVTSSGGPG